MPRVRGRFAFPTRTEEDDEDPKLWYLAATANAQSGDKVLARENLDTVEQLIGKSKEFEDLKGSVARLRKTIERIPDLDDACEVGEP